MVSKAQRLAQQQYSFLKKVFYYFTTQISCKRMTQMNNKRLL